MTKPSVSKSTNQLRIIGGEWKRRQLPFASIEGLRPTPDRIRETLFNWLMWDIQQSQVLDLCAGSGALGFEALSRGAAHVTMIEPNSSQCQFLKQNISLLKTEQCEVMHSTAEQALTRLTDNQFDLVFLDPPYSLDLWSTLASNVDPMIKKQGLIYVEADRDLSQLQLPAHWNLLKQTKAGVVRAGLYQKAI
ncbi:16S rRNA (guanine(966)-N(2))-methyltransferase RsmD [Acinetobacter rudis]|uniref:Ribosomal RNA small subunit methyltransferase D n=1 Tax=Acinetobacter rudis CIP 110305 TaxID=421052 RepID=S3PMB9_9GAMM|nr:16S rRNA (guanine(966)-N(2))-methyltransferase RsmD [Acinetobacter rudis]EPF79956.1 RsmD family RNA methyltransferase [Acinetobacter rudis CIP 110305]